MYSPLLEGKPVYVACWISVLRKGNLTAK